MGKRSREKRERRLRGEIAEEKEKPEFGLGKILKRIIFLGTCLILFTPLIVSSDFFFPFVGPKSLYFMGLVEIIFFTWLFLLFFYPKYRPRLNLPLIALILFLAIFIISSLFGIEPFYSFWSKFERMTGVLMLLHLFAFFLVIFSVFKEKDWLKIFSVSIFVSVILSFIALASKNPAMRGGATIGNDSFLGTYLLFNLFLAIYLIFKTEGGLKIYSSICLSIMALEIFLSGARASKLSFLGGLVLIFFFWLIFQKKGKLRWIALSVLVLGIIFTLCFVYFTFQPESFVRKEIIKKVVGEETLGGRFVVWEGAWKHIMERPLLGLGPENFETVFPKYFNPCMFLPQCGGEIWFDRAHNIIFDTLLNTGILGLLSYILIFLSVFYVLWKGYLKEKIGFWTSAIFSALLISYFVQNLTVFDMVSSYMMFFLILGFITSLLRNGLFQIVSPYTTPKPHDLKEPVFSAEKKYSTFSFNQKKINFQKQLIGILLLIIFFFSFSKFIIQPLKTDFYVIKALKSQSPLERISWYKKSLDASPVARYQIREHFANFALEFGQSERAKQFSREDYKSELDFVSQELEKTIKESPLNYRSYLFLGQVYNAYVLIDPSKLSSAEEVLKKTIELSPTNQQGYWALTQTKLYQGKFQEALSLAEKALELEKRLPRSHLIVIQVAKFTGDNELAKKKAEEAMKLIPELEPEIKKILEG